MNRSLRPTASFGSLPRLSRRGLLRHIDIAALGKPAERRGRKATGLKRGAMTAGLPARCKCFRRSENRAVHARASRPHAQTRRCLPVKRGRRTATRSARHERHFLLQARGPARQLNLAHPLTLGVLAVLALGILGGAFALGMQLGRGDTQRGCARRAARWAQSWPSRSSRSPSSSSSAGARRRHGHAPGRGERARHPPRCARQAPHRDGGHRQPRIRFRP